MEFYVLGDILDELIISGLLFPISDHVKNHSQTIAGIQTTRWRRDAADGIWEMSWERGGEGGGVCE